MRKGVLRSLSAALGVVFLVALAYPERRRAIRGDNDFVQLYAGAKLVGTPDLYSRQANLALIRATLGFTMESVVYTRPPFYAALLKPLAALPYRVAYGVFSLATLSCVIWFAVRFSKDYPALPLFTATSVPALTALCGGQDTPFLLAILGVSILLTRRKRDVSAGLVLSLCALKFHLFLFLPVLLLGKRRWRILGGAGVGSVILAGFGLLLAGADSVRQYVTVLRDPWINPPAAAMPNIHGLAAVLHGDGKLEFLLAAVVLGTFLWTMRRTENYELLLAASIVGGLLMSFHCGLADTIILLPAFILAVAARASARLRIGMGLILTPIPYLMALAKAPYSAFLPISMLLLLGMFCMERNGAFPHHAGV